MKSSIAILYALCLVLPIKSIELGCINNLIYPQNINYTGPLNITYDTNLSYSVLTIRWEEIPYLFGLFSTYRLNYLGICSNHTNSSICIQYDFQFNNITLINNDYITSNISHDEALLSWYQHHNITNLCQYLDRLQFLFSARDEKSKIKEHITWFREHNNSNVIDSLYQYPNINNLSKDEL